MGNVFPACQRAMVAMANEQQQAVEKIERDLAELRRLFELYFRGLERFPPTEMYESLKKRTSGLLMEAARWRTADKFRANTAYHKFQTYDRMWARELKAVEEGTSRRDKFLKNRKQGASPDDAPAARAAAAAPAATPQPGAGTDEEKLRRLYNVYMQAKKRTGEASNLSLDGLRRQLEKQVPLIKQKHKCNDVDFKVVLKDGKAMLKAVPK